MPFKHITLRDVNNTLKVIQSRGIPQDQWKGTLDEVLGELDYHRHKKYAAAGPIALFGKGLVGSIPKTHASMIRGFQAFTPKGLAQTGLDILSAKTSLPKIPLPQTPVEKLMNVSTEKLENIPSPYWERDVGEAAAGPMWPPSKEMAKTWAAMFGSNLPVVGESIISSSIGGAIGAGIAGKTGAQIGTHVGGWASMAALEHDGFMSATEDLPVDEWRRKLWALAYGSVSGLMEHAQMVLMKGPWGKAFGKAATPIAKSLMKSTANPFFQLLKGPVSTATSALFGGAEELGQGVAFNNALNQMVSEQNVMNKEEGLPPVDPELVAGKIEDLSRSFAAGVGLYLMTGGLGRAVGGAKTRIAARRAKKITKKAGAQVWREIESGKTREEIFGEAPGAPSVAQFGTAKEKERAARDMTPEEMTEKVDVLPNIGKTVEYDTKMGRIKAKVRGIVDVAKSWGIPLKDAKGKNYSFNQLKQLVKQQIGAITEGPMWVPLKGLQFIKPSVNPVLPSDIQRGQILERAIKTTASQIKSELAVWLDKLARSIREGKPVTPLKQEALELGLTEQELKETIGAYRAGGPRPELVGKEKQMLVDRSRRRTLINSAFYEALEPVLGEKLANELLSLERTSINPKKLSGLEDVLTRKQYTDYLQNLEGEVRNLYRLNDGQTALDQLNVDLEDTYNLANIQTPDGTVIDPETIPEPRHLPWWRRWAALVPSLNDIADRLNMPQIMGLDMSVFFGHKLEQKTRIGLRMAQTHIWRSVPKALRTGLPGRYMAELVHYLATDAEQKPQLAKVLKVENNTTAFINRVADASTFKDKREILNQANQLKEKNRTLYNWFARNGAVRPEQFRHDYVPVYRLYIEKTKGDVPFENWVKENQKTVDELSRLTNAQVTDLVELADQLVYWRNRGMAIPGKAEPWFTYARTESQEFLKDMGRLTDIREITDVYINRAVRKAIFGPLVPAVRAITQRALDTAPNAEDKKILRTVFNNYFETIMGVPDTGARALQRTNISSVSRVTTGITNLGIRSFNLIAPPDLKVQVREADPALNAQDAMNSAITLLYGTTLGIPFNFMSPIKNITQSFMAIPALGVRTWLQGIASFYYNPGVRKQVMEANVRPEYPLQEMAVLGGKNNRWAATTKVFLSLYRMSDLLNVWTTAAGGVVAWNRLAPILEKDPTGKSLTDQQIVDALFRQRNPKVDDKEVMRRGIPSDLKFKGVVSKPVALQAVEWIREGRSQDAKNLYLQYLVNFSQWRYGAGGTPGYLRNAFMRAAFMYTSWPTNYIDYMRTMAKPGIWPRYVQALTGQILYCSLIASIGLPTWRWIMFGPLPDELVPTGPAIQMLSDIYKLIVGGAEALQTQVLPFAPAEEKKAAWKRVRNQVNDLVDVGMLDKRVLKLLGEES